MIEALESRQLLSVPNIAGHWVGAIGLSVDGGAAQHGTTSVQFVQRGKAVACVESDSLDAGVAYCRGSIDAKGRMHLNWSVHRSMRPVLGSGIGQLKRGKITFLITGQTVTGSTLLGAFKVHRG